MEGDRPKCLSESEICEEEDQLVKKVRKGRRHENARCCPALASTILPNAASSSSMHRLLEREQPAGLP